MAASNGTKGIAWGLLWLRVLMGLGIASHGWQKVIGGGMAGFVEGVGQLGLPMPEVFAWAAAFSELIGGICVALGLGTRIAAAAVFATMSVAAFRVHAQDAFRVKELALCYWTMAGALIFMGGGPFALEQRLGKR